MFTFLIDNERFLLVLFFHNVISISVFGIMLQDCVQHGQVTQTLSSISRPHLCYWWCYWVSQRWIFFYRHCYITLSFVLKIDLMLRLPLCSLAGIKTACIMRSHMPQYWKCRPWWPSTRRTYWLQATQWKRHRLCVNGVLSLIH